MQTGKITGLQIVSRAVLDVIGNHNAALRISVPWMTPAAAFFLLENLLPLSAKTGALWIMSLLVLLVYVMVSLTAIAIAWHRFVLKGETPSGLFVFSSQWQLGRYLFRGIAICLLLVLALLPFMFIFPDAFGVGPGADREPSTRLLYLLVTALLSYAFYRLCILLPAIALARRDELGRVNPDPHTFAWAWRTTKPFALQIITVSVIASGMGFGIDYMNSLFLGPEPASAGGVMYYVGLVVVAVTQWCWCMFTLSLMTTLYGYLCMDQDESSGSSKSV